MQETARRLGKNYWPRLARADEPSTATYGIEAKPLPIAGNKPIDEAISELPQGGVRYTTEQSTEPAAWLRWWMRGGTARWSLGPRLALTGWGLAGLALILVLVVVAYARAVTARGPVTFGDLWLLVTLGLVGWIMWLEDRYSSALLDLRIVMAPVIVTRLRDHGVTLELRRAEREEEDSHLVLSKYTAACALCTGTVEIANGRRAFPDRLVGRCRRSPREHVFSFDPVLRIGSPLQ